MATVDSIIIALVLPLQSSLAVSDLTIGSRSSHRCPLGFDLSLSFSIRP